MTVKILILTSIHTILNIGGISLIKNVVKDYKLSGIADYFSFLFNYRFILGVLMVTSGFFLMMKILQLIKFSMFVPLTSALSFLVASLIAVFFLEEQITLRMGVGMAIILLGIYILAWE